MAYARKPRTTVRRRTYRKRPANTIKKLNRKVNRIYSSLKPELKVSDSNALAFRVRNPSSGSSTQFLEMILPDPGLTSGTSYFNERVGSHIRVRSISIRGWLSCPEYQANVRMLLVRWPKDIVQSLSQVLISTAQNEAVFSPTYPNTTQKFQILWDKTIVLAPFGNDSKPFRYFKKCNFPVTYLADATSVESGQMILYVFSNFADDSSTAPLLNLYCRTRYTDV